MATRGPLPGMDPWLEPDWSDGRLTLAVLLSTALNETLPLDLVARIDEGQVVIRELSGRVVTWAAVLGREEKSPSGWRARHLDEREQRRRAGVNVVELDLNRSGEPTTIAATFDYIATRRSPYHASIWSAEPPSRVVVFPIPLRQPMPVCPIPLRPGEPHAAVALQPLFDECYRSGRYEMVADYDSPPEPPLSPDDAAWARERIEAWRRADA